MALITLLALIILLHFLLLHLTYCVGLKSNGYNFVEELNHCSAFFSPRFPVLSNVLIDFHMHGMIALPISLLIPTAGHIQPPSRLCLLTIAASANTLPAKHPIYNFQRGKNIFLETSKLAGSLIFLANTKP